MKYHRCMYIMPRTYISSPNEVEEKKVETYKNLNITQ